MAWFWIIAAVALVSFVPEYFLSYRQNRWHGLILPAVFFGAASVFLLLNLFNAFPNIEGYGAFLQRYGGTGFFALILKIGFLYTPTVVHLILHFICRHRYNKTHNPAKHNKEYKKMLADDL